MWRCLCWCTAWLSPCLWECFRYSLLRSPGLHIFVCVSLRRKISSTCAVPDTRFVWTSFFCACVRKTNFPFGTNGRAQRAGMSTHSMRPFSDGVWNCLVRQFPSRKLPSTYTRAVGTRGGDCVRSGLRMQQRVDLDWVISSWWNSQESTPNREN